MSFLEVFWLIVVSFAFVAYLMVMFSIIVDLFRDHGTSGWLKAVWIIFLIVFPLITALVYLIARGDGMAERSAKEYKEVKAAQDEYIRSVASPTSVSDQIAQGKALLDSGAITQAEFDQLKAKALS